MIGSALACSSADVTQSPASPSPSDPSQDGDPSASSGGPSSSSGGSSSGASSSGGSSGSILPTGPDGIQVVTEPSDNAGALLTAIQGAKTSVHVVMYLLDDKRFINALIARHQAGVDVKVMLNHTFPGGQGSNGSAYNQLQSAGITVAWAPAGFTLTHEKCVIIDAATAWIMTMNLETSSPQNREFLAIDKEPGDVQEAETIFEADLANKSSSPGGHLVVAPNNARPMILALIQSATQTIDVEGEELSDTQVTAALIAAKKQGVAVRVVVSNVTPTPAQQTAVQQLGAAQVQVKTLANPYVHAKALVVDGAHAYVGSANFTSASMLDNRELGVITNNAQTAASVAKTIAGDFASGT